MMKRTADKIDRYFWKGLMGVLVLVFVTAAWPLFAPSPAGSGSNGAKNNGTSNGGNGGITAVQQPPKTDPIPPAAGTPAAGDDVLNDVAKAVAEMESLDFDKAFATLCAARQKNIPSSMLRADIDDQIVKASVLKRMTKDLPRLDTAQLKMQKLKLQNDTSLVCLQVKENGDKLSLVLLTGEDVTVEKDKVSSSVILTDDERDGVLAERLGIFERNLKVRKPAFGPFEHFSVGARAMQLGLKKKAFESFAAAFSMSKGKDLETEIRIGVAEKMFNDAVGLDSVDLIAEAEANYRKVVRDFSDTQFARKAQEMLDAMSQKKKKSAASAGITIKLEHRTVQPTPVRVVQMQQSESLFMPVKDGGMVFNSSSLQLTRVNLKKPQASELVAQADENFIKGYDEYVKGNPSEQGQGRDAQGYGHHLRLAIGLLQKASESYSKAQDIEDNSIVDFRMTHVYKYLDHAIKMAPVN